jgi:hypothetical protein
MSSPRSWRSVGAPVRCHFGGEHGGSRETAVGAHPEVLCGEDDERKQHSSSAFLRNSNMLRRLPDNPLLLDCDALIRRMSCGHQRRPSPGRRQGIRMRMNSDIAGRDRHRDAIIYGLASWLTAATDWAPTPSGVHHARGRCTPAVRRRRTHDGAHHLPGP